MHLFSYDVRPVFIACVVLIVASVCAFGGTVEALQTGKSYMSESGYIEYIPGDAPLILAAPHGGLLEPDDIPNRVGGTSAHDVHTMEITRLFADAFYDLTGYRPHVIINLLHRRKLDANREIREAAEGNAQAEQVWYEYHAFIDRAKHDVTEQFGAGFYIDVHGHSHAVQRVELGYELSASRLRQSDHELNNDKQTQTWNTVRSLYETHAESTTFAQLLRGPTSFGALLESRGVPSVPSNVQPAPEAGWEYFVGGYNTKRHTSYDGGPISGLLLEINRAQRTDLPTRQRFAQALAEAAAEFLALHYGHENYVPIRVFVSEPHTNGDGHFLTGAVVTEAIDLTIETAYASPKDVHLAVDEATVFSGDTLPANIAIDPAALSEGYHVLSVTLADDGQIRRTYSTHFRVQHFVLDSPWSEEEPGAIRRLTGAASLVVQPASPMAEGQRAVVSLRRVETGTNNGASASPNVLAEGALPLAVALDSANMADGGYELVIAVTTAKGITTERVERILINNWKVLEDELLPPKDMGWLGFIDALKTSDKSSGWVYATQNEAMFYSDASRLHRGAATDEFLTWKMDRVRRYEFTLFAPNRDVHDSIAVHVSANGTHWQEVEFETMVTGDDPSTAWLRLLLWGDIPPDHAANYVRLTFNGDHASPERLQLGRAVVFGER